MPEDINLTQTLKELFGESQVIEINTPRDLRKLDNVFLRTESITIEPMIRYAYRFYVNQQKDEQGRLLRFLDGYQLGDALELAYSGEVEAPNPLCACEMLFEIFNINHPKDYRNRSMSVGDVVVLQADGIVTYACQPVGFKLVANLEGSCR